MGFLINYPPVQCFPSAVGVRKPSMLLSPQTKAINPFFGDIYTNSVHSFVYLHLKVKKVSVPKSILHTGSKPTELSVVTRWWQMGRAIIALEFYGSMSSDWFPA